jgi:sulfur-oxidizing protein SoxY
MANEPGIQMHAPNSRLDSGFGATRRPGMTAVATRRAFLAGAGAALIVRPAKATPASMAAAIREITGTAEAKPGKIKLNIPPLVENGNSVAITVSVDSPMIATNYVKAIHVLTEKNPQPNVISAKLGPRSGKAEISTRIRLADTQSVVALCELSDGTFWSDKVDVILTISACLEDPV